MVFPLSCFFRFPMKHRDLGLAFLVLALGLGGGVSRGQPADPGTPYPRLLRTLPTGATIGTETILSLYGNDLESPTAIIATHPGIKAEILPDEGQKKDPKAPPSPNPRIRLTVAREVPPGDHGIRLINAWGASNLKVLPLSWLAESEEKEPNNETTQATPVSWNTQVSGTLSAGTDVDYFSLDLPDKTPLVLYCQASSIQSPAEPRLELISPTGKVIATNHHYRGGDALICQKITQAGKYLVRVSEWAYNRGGPDFVYRLYAGSGPWIETIRPLALPAQPSLPVTLTGFGLTPTSQGKGPASETWTLSTHPHQFQPLAYLGRPERRQCDETLLSWNPGLPTGTPQPALTLPVTNLPVAVEKETNDSFETAQEIATPVDLSGGLDKPGDVDLYRFSAKKGETVRIDLLPTLSGTFTQGTLKVLTTDKDRRTVISREDEGPLQYPKFFQKSLDISTEFTPPADGSYAIRIGSRVSQSVYGPAASYRLRIQPAKPAFLAYAVAPLVQNPGAVQINRGAHAVILIYLQRLHGFAGEVAIQVEGLPAGLSADPLTIPGNQSVGQLILKATDQAAETQQPLRIFASAAAPAPKQPVFPLAMRTVLPNAGIVLPIAGVDPEIMVAVRGTAPFLLKATPDKPALKPGEKTEIKVQLTRKVPDKTVVAVQGFEGPANLLNNQPQNINADKDEVKLPVNVDGGLAPGTYQVSIRGQSAIPYAKDPGAKQKPATNMVTWSNPVSLEILPKTIGTFVATPEMSPWKVGQPARLTIKVTRVPGFAGEIKLTHDEKGDGLVKIQPATLPAGGDSVTLSVEIAPNTPPGARGNLTLLAEGQWKSRFPMTQKIPLNLNLVK